jgi:hypothetical protein
MGRLIPLFFFVNLTLVVIALIDCLSSDDVGIRALPKVVWVFIILLFSPVAPIVWFIAGRPVATRGSSAAGLGRLISKRSQRRPLAPDDDPEFLASLAKRRKDDETLLQMWEADLRRREEELRSANNGTASAPQEGDVSTERDQPTPPGDGDDRPGGSS